MGLEYFLNHPRVMTHQSKEYMRLKLPVHQDNLEILKPHLSNIGEGLYATQKVKTDSIKKIIALEGPIFRSAPQLLHMALAIEGLNEGYLFADPITFAEEFAPNDTAADVRRKIYSNWTNVINNSDLTLAMTEYGQGYDPGVVTGSIIQLDRGNPVLGLELKGNERNDIFANTIEHYYVEPEDFYLDPSEINIFKGGHKILLHKLIKSKLNNLEKPLFSFEALKDSCTKNCDILVVHENNLEGFMNARSVKEKLNEVGRGVTFPKNIYNLYDLARFIAKSNQVVVLGDDSSEPGIIGSSAIQIANIMETPVDMLRGDFRILTGEGEGAGFRQPDKGLYGASNLMIENLLPRGTYTKIDSLVNDLKKN